MTRFYVCVKSFRLECYDDDGYVIENKYAEIKKGEIFKKSEDEYRFVGGNDTIKLENDGRWVEILPETLAKYFEPTEKDGAEE